MIKVFTDKNFLTESYRKVIFPLLFHLHFKNNTAPNTLYTICATMDEADIVILPASVEYYHSSGHVKTMDSLIRQAESRAKTIWAYSSGDLGLTIPGNVVIFRFGGFNSKLSKNTMIIPAHTTDPFSVLSRNFSALPKEYRPRIGFVGNAHESMFKWIKEYYVFMYFWFHRLRKTIPSDPQRFYPSGIKRFRILKSMQKNQLINTDFIFRMTYRGGAITAKERDSTQLEFYNNIYNNPYTLCVRGTGNFSVRFYETLAMGRIPVLVDTDCRLPFEPEVDWSKHCVRVRPNNIERDLIEFHESVSDRDFLDMQERNRRFWLSSLDGPKFFVKLHELIATG